MPKSFLNNATLPRGLRNNNPGNLRRTSIAWLGKIPHPQSADQSFEQFYELRYGLRALMRDLHTDYKQGSNTIRKLIEEYAPAFENNTQAYINSVADDLDMGPDQLIVTMTAPVLVAITKAIVKFEVGAPFAAYISSEDYSDALAILGLELSPVKKKK